MATDLNKWKRAVIHLECATDSKSIEERRYVTANLFDRYERKEITKEDFIQELESNEAQSRDIRYQGTAIFLEDNLKHYLITARHVLWDKTVAQHELSREQQSHNFDPQHAIDHYNDAIFSVVFRVPSLYETNTYNPEEPFLPFLMNMGSGAGHPLFTYSTPELDLAIVSLNDEIDKPFVTHLISRGYLPISIGDIENEPYNDGDDIIAIGFPRSTSLAMELTITPMERMWRSSDISVPITSFGKVAMIHPQLPFFWGDISIYPGNSGGPIIHNNKLVGLVSQQAIIPIDGIDQDVFVRIPFAKVIKAGHILELLNFHKHRVQILMAGPSTL